MSSRLLIAIPNPVFDQFIGDAGFRSLAGTFESICRVDPSALSAQDWVGQFQEAKPTALLSGWGTPPVPESTVGTLRLVAHTAGGVRHLVTRAMIEQGLWVTNWGAMAAPTVAEHALTLTLATLRRLSRWTRVMQVQREWVGPEPDTGISLFGKRVGIHGFGAVARQFVKLIAPFGCSISAYSSGVPHGLFEEYGVTPSESLEHLFATSDVLVEVESLTPESRGSVTGDLLQRLPHGAAFINVGRGAVVDQDALITAVQTGRLHVGLDVFDTEPLRADSPLRSLPNVILTPHVAGPTIDHRQRCGHRAIQSLLQFAAGKVPDGLITPDIYDRST